MRPAMVVMKPEVFDHDPGFGQAVKELQVQALISQLAVEGLSDPVLPRGAGLDVETPRRPAEGTAVEPGSSWHGLRELEDAVIGRKSCHLPHPEMWI